MTFGLDVEAWLNLEFRFVGVEGTNLTFGLNMNAGLNLTFRLVRREAKRAV